MQFQITQKVTWTDMRAKVNSTGTTTTVSERVGRVVGEEEGLILVNYRGKIRRFHPSRLKAY